MHGSLVFLALLGIARAGPGCVDENGNAVDWFSGWKLPNGYQATFFDSARGGDLTRVSADLSTSANPVQQTLNGVHSAQGFLMYNDEHPESSLRGLESSKYGHTKGVLAFDAAGGFWLVHSVPRFPHTTDFGFPEDETIYGQSFTCLTLTREMIERAGSLMLLNKPSVYSSSLPSSLASTYPSVAGVLNKDWVKTPNATATYLITQGGVTFTAFGKNAEWDSELYADLVAPFFSNGMQTETWIRNPPLDSYCPKPGQSPPFEVRNVRDVTIGGTAWHYTQDHSKWGITETMPMVCIGDINRMGSQASRGGGTVCQPNQAMWNQLKAAITTVDSC